MFYQKLAVPRLVPHVLPRQELLGQIDAAFAHAQVVLLTAPAGWGKTTIAASWARARQLISVSWYVLDRADQNPLVFLGYLITALLPHCPTLQPLLDQLRDAGGGPQQQLIDQMVDVLAERAEPIYLMLDDVQEICASPADTAQPIFDLLQMLVRYAPSVRMVLISRAIIPTMMSLRVRGSLEIVGTSTLAFSAADVIELTNVRYGRSIAAEQAAALVRWSRGWPAAVVLSLEEHYRQRPQGAAEARTAPAISASDHLDIFLLEQVYAPLPPPLQSFLVETAVLTSLTPQGCDALRGTDNAAQLLTEVRHRALFVDACGDRLSYQEFFRTFLLRLLWETPARARDYLRRAAELHQRWGEPQPAFAIWLELGDLAAAAALVLADGPKLRQRCEYATVQGWLDQLRARGPLAPPLLLLQIRVAIDMADWNSAYAAIQQALLCQDADVVVEARLLETLIACLRKEARASALLAGISLEALPPRLAKLGYEIAGRVALCKGDTAASIRLLKQVLATCGSAGAKTDDSDLAHVYDLLGMALATDRDFASAMYYLRRADATWQVLGNGGRRVITLNNLALLLAEEGNLALARSYLEEAMHLAEQHARQRERILLMCSMADLAIIDADFDAALVYYAAAAEQVGPQSYGERVYACAGALRAAALGRDQAACRRWVQALDSISVDHAAVYAGPVALARALAASDPLVALEHLEHAEQAPLYAPHDQAQMLLLRAQLAYLQAGWPAAAPHWRRLEDHLRGSSLDALLQVQGNATPGLLAAAGRGPLARRLRADSARSVMRWEFYALGVCEVICNGQALTTPMRPINQLALIRLLEAGPAGLPTLQLWEDVWGDQPFSSDALRQALSRIRRSLGLPIQLHKGHCLLQMPWSNVGYDVAQFEAQLPAPTSVERLRERIAIYRGAFLSNLHHESHWLRFRRTSLHRRCLLLREELALAIEQTDPRGALHIYGAVLEEDGCREAAASGAMRCAARLGDRVLAILIYQQFCRQLIDNLGTDPSPMIMQVYQQIA